MITPMVVKGVRATWDGSRWTVVFESPPGDPITPRQLLLLDRAIMVQQRIYYGGLRRASLKETRAKITASAEKSAQDAKLMLARKGA